MINYNEIMFLKDKMPIKVDMIYNDNKYFDAFVLCDNNSLVVITYKEGIITITDNDKDKVKFIVKNN